HHRLQQVQAGALGAVLKCHRSCNFEGGPRRIDLVEAPVIEAGLRVDDGIPGEYSAAHGLPDALLDRWDELLRDDAADDVVIEDEARAARTGLDLDLYVTVLAVTAGLANIAAFRFRLFVDGFAVCDLGLPDVGLYFEFPLEAVDDDLEVKLAHSSDDRLPGLFVRERAKRRIFVCELLQAQTELVDIRLSLRLDCDRDDRLGKHDLLEQNAGLLVAERVASAGISKAYCGVNVAGIAFLE